MGLISGEGTVTHAFSSYHLCKTCMVGLILNCDSQVIPSGFLGDFLQRKVSEGPLYTISSSATMDVVWGVSLLINLGKPAGRLKISQAPPCC